MHDSQVYGTHVHAKKKKKITLDDDGILLVMRERKHKR